MKIIIQNFFVGGNMNSVIDYDKIAREKSHNWLGQGHALPLEYSSIDKEIVKCLQSLAATNREIHKAQMQTADALLKIVPDRSVVSDRSKKWDDPEVLRGKYRKERENLRSEGLLEEIECMSIDRSAKTLDRFKELIGEANELTWNYDNELNNIENDEIFWRSHTPKCQGWITSASATVQSISSKNQSAKEYAKQVTSIVEKAERNTLDDTVRDIAAILIRIVKDIEEGLIPMETDFYG